jgi:pyruvate kinase
MGESMARRTKIVATVGPASLGEASLRSLVGAGVDAFRLNFSYGSHSEHSEAASLIRRLSRESGRPVAVIQDLQGPKIRIGTLATSPSVLEPGAEVIFTPEADQGDPFVIPVNYPALPREVRPGHRILLGDGEVELRVEAVVDAVVRARVVEGGVLKENQGVHLPGASLGAEPFSEKDVSDLGLGLSLGVDYVALSFVRNGEEVRGLKRLIAAEGARVPVIAKLERREAIENLDDILTAADGVMVARGDLGLEFPLEQVPLLQKEIIQRANERGALVITATQMLESMVQSPRPTRAEVSDVANAILDGTDSIMLSAETAVGRYPVHAVRIMARIAEETDQRQTFGNIERRRPTHAHAMSRAACELARDAKASAVVVFTRAGYSAHLVSKERPPVPVFAFTASTDVAQRLALWWGVVPLLAEWPDSVEEMEVVADRQLCERGLLRTGDSIVMAHWSALRRKHWTNFVHLHRLYS